MVTNRWTDDRLDDLRGTVDANDHRLDTVQDLGQSNDRRITDIERNLERQTSLKMSQPMLIATWASPIVTLTVALIVILTGK